MTSSCLGTISHKGSCLGGMKGPFFFILFRQEAARGQRAGGDGDSLKLLLTGGEWLEKATIKETLQLPGYCGGPTMAFHQARGLGALRLEVNTRGPQLCHSMVLP